MNQLKYNRTSSFVFNEEMKNIFSYYFNQCFRPFHPKMCQDWVMTVMQVNSFDIL